MFRDATAGKGFSRDKAGSPRRPPSSNEGLQTSKGILLEEWRRDNSKISTLLNGILSLSSRAQRGICFSADSEEKSRFLAPMESGLGMTRTRVGRSQVTVTVTVSIGWQAASAHTR